MKLKLNEIGFLKTLYKEANQLSLFSNIDGKLAGGEKESLEKKMVIKDGAVTKVWGNILAPMANPDRCTRVILRDGDYLVEKYSYQNDAGLTLVENNGDGELQLTLPDGIKPQLLELSKWIGMSNLTSMEIELELSVAETFILLALTDLVRQSIFTGFLKNSTAVKLDKQSLLEQLENPAENSLYSILKVNYEVDIPTAEDIDGIVDSLKDKKLLELVAGEYSMSQDVVVMAMQMLVPQSILLIENLELNIDGNLGANSYLAVTAGVKDILLFAFEGGSIRLISMTSMQLLKLIEDLLLFNKGESDK